MMRRLGAGSKSTGGWIANPPCYDPAVSHEADTAVAPGRILVLFADIAGSTKLYEDFGDARARDATAACVSVMSDLVAQFGGRVLKTIGDEIMAVFDDPARGVMAGTDMQGAVRQASEGGRFVTGTLRIKVGLHFGRGMETADDVFGEAAVVAQEVVKLAKADQVLTTADTLQLLPPMLRSGSRHVDQVKVAGVPEEVEVYELIWEVSGLTQMASTEPLAPRITHTRLHLDYAGNAYRVDADEPELRLGRVAGNDIVVPADLTSRQHAHIELRRGRFLITDNSANGTLIVNDEGGTTSLRRDHVALSGSGLICLGGTQEDNPDCVVRFRCE
jgi:class 3 adenylate cyclase